MRFTIDWVAEHTDVGDDPEALLKGLLAAGFPLESREPLPGGGERLEIEVGPNRSDLLSILGVAREIAAFTGGAVRLPRSPSAAGGERTEGLCSVAVSARKGCPHYTARVIRGVRVGPSPGWLRDRLESVGLRSVNNVVDATNYVLWETGQPLHAFDLERLAQEDGKVALVVRRARRGEKLVTLDGKERELTKDVLVIADPKGPVALGGVMGGEATEVRQSTKDILLESAYFDPVVTRRARMAVKLDTDASHRFERGVDPLLVGPASERCAALITEVAGGTVLDGVVEAGAPRWRPRSVRLGVRRLSRLLGVSISADVAVRLLARYGFERDASKAGLRFRVPSYRGDVAAEIDLVEEVARSYGYDEIPEGRSQRSFAAAPSREQTMDAEARGALAGLGFHEAHTAALTDPEAARLLRALTAEGEPAAVRSPMSAEQSTLRPSLWPGLVASAGVNHAAGRKDVKLFEIGVRFLPPAAGERPAERRTTSGVLTGARLPEGWEGKPPEVDLYDATGALEELFRAWRAPAPSFRPGARGCLDPAASAVVLLADGKGEEREVGVVGRLRGELAERWGLAVDAWLFEVDVPTVAERRREGVTFERLLRYPAAYRDVAVTVPRDVLAGDLLETIRAAGGDRLESARLFDRYEGPPIPDDHRGMAFALSYRWAEGTLTDREVDEVHARVVQALESRHGARLR